MASETVLFNVGGTKYEVAKTTIESYPQTMLARLVSERWNQSDRQELFIDRDGLQFRYVLNYMRTQKVNLPVNVTKASILEDLQYFGFENVTDDAFDGGSNHEAATCVAACQKKYEVELQNIEKGINDLKRKKHFMKAALECYRQYTSKGSYECSLPPFSTEAYQYFYVAPMTGEALECFQECLAPSGLQYVSHTSPTSTYRTTVTLAPLSVDGGADD